MGDHIKGYHGIEDEAILNELIGSEQCKQLGHPLRKSDASEQRNHVNPTEEVEINVEISSFFENQLDIKKYFYWKTDPEVLHHKCTGRT